ncbi:hypothetical protein EVAR_80914_1 [Eumeta japonica]|uniref:Uncharacterized protein n=1 Tax=Eumeta variegata TaxID=151549 RepID=A0A4C1V1J0_EUMVA|nr:hypothetical protein EVAR_80914_1 [Eumeta japonica]
MRARARGGRRVGDGNWAKRTTGEITFSNITRVRRRVAASIEIDLGANATDQGPSSSLRCGVWESVPRRRRLQLCTARRKLYSRRRYGMRVFGTVELPDKPIMLPPFVEATHCLVYHLTRKGRAVADRVVSVLGYACPDITYSPTLYPITAALLHFMPACRPVSPAGYARRCLVCVRAGGVVACAKARLTHERKRRTAAVKISLHRNTS